MPDAPLHHLRVIDCTDLRGALAGRLLADLGADVVKIDPPSGDAGRGRPPFAGDVADPDRSLPFLYRNANKRAAVIDWTRAEGRERFARLCAAADVLIDNCTGDAREQFELAPAVVRARHPHLVHVAMADFGLTGPRAAWRAEPLPAFAASGALWASGFPDRPPCWVPGFLPHDCAAVFGVVGALIALLSRPPGADGESIEISVQEAAINALNPWSIPLADYARLYPLLPASPPRNADGAYLVLPTRDGFFRILPGTPRHWRAFVALLGNPEALSGSEWELPIYRLLNTDVIRLIASDALRDRTRAEVFAEAQRLGLPSSPVHTPDEFAAAEQTRARGYFSATGFPHLGEAPFAPGPFHFSRTPSALRRPAPRPGQDDGDFTPRAATQPASAAQQLRDLLVIDLGVGAVGPEVGWVFVECGAEVIKL